MLGAGQCKLLIHAIAKEVEDVCPSLLNIGNDVFLLERNWDSCTGSGISATCVIVAAFAQHARLKVSQRQEVRATGERP